MGENRALTVAQAAERWQVTEKCLYELLRKGEIVAFKIGCQWRIPIEPNERPKNNNAPAGY